MITNGFGTHLPLLTHAVMVSEGPVLECGGGFCSTPVLDALLRESGRMLVTADENENWYLTLSRMFACHWHIVRHVASWEKFLERFDLPWGLVLVDNDPAETEYTAEHYDGRLTVLRMLPREAITIVHDTQDERIAEDAWWKERVASSPFVWTHEACGIQTTLLAVKELPEIGVRTWHRQ